MHAPSDQDIDELCEEIEELYADIEYLWIKIHFIFYKNCELQLQQQPSYHPF